MLSLPVVIALIAESGEINAPYELMIRHEIWGLVALSSLFGCGLGLGTSALYKYFAPATVMVCNNTGKCIGFKFGAAPRKLTYFEPS